MVCEYCGKSIDGWYLTYKGKVFCREKDDRCIKEFLFEEHDAEIGTDIETDNACDWHTDEFFKGVNDG